MKPLHKIGNPDKKEYGEYAQIKNGKVAVTNNFSIAVFSAEEVFGKGVFTDTDEFYFKLKDWKELKLNTADSFRTDGLKLKGFKKFDPLGEIQLLKKSEILFVFPNYPAATPDHETYDYSILLDAKGLFALSETIGGSGNKVLLRLRGNKPISVKGLKETTWNVLDPGHSEAYPNGFSDPELRPKELTLDERITARDIGYKDDRISTLEDVIEELREKLKDKDEELNTAMNELKDLQESIPGEIATCNSMTGRFSYATSNLRDRDTLEIVAEAMQTFQPTELQDLLKIILR